MIKPKSKRCKSCLTLFRIESNGKCQWCNKNTNKAILVVRNR